MSEPALSCVFYSRLCSLFTKLFTLALLVTATHSVHAHHLGVMHHKFVSLPGPAAESAKFSNFDLEISG
jgi:hypothetical protein